VEPRMNTNGHEHAAVPAAGVGVFFTRLCWIAFSHGSRRGLRSAATPLLKSDFRVRAERAKPDSCTLVFIRGSFDMDSARGHGRGFGFQRFSICPCQRPRGFRLSCESESDLPEPDERGSERLGAEGGGELGCDGGV
jgi:hypothetical protein